MMIRIAIADDQGLLRESLAVLLEQQEDFRVVGSAGDGVEACRMVHETDIDVLLLDIRMPLLDGLDVLKELKRNAFPGRVVMLTMYQDDLYLRKALSLGADGYLLKDSESETIISTIRQVSVGNRVLDRQVLDHVVQCYLHERGRSPGEVPELQNLTARELEVLTLIGSGLTNLEIREQLYISEGTLKSHINAILRKTGARDRSAAIVLAFRAGLVTFS